MLRPACERGGTMEEKFSKTVKKLFRKLNKNENGKFVRFKKFAD